MKEKQKPTIRNRLGFAPLLLLWIVMVCSLVACAGPAFNVVPPESEHLLDREATFEKLSTSPDAYEGRLVMLTGMVLNTKILPKFSRVELLQLPLDADGLPVTDLNASQGRFLAKCHGVINPQRIPSGTRLSVIGEMKGITSIEGNNYAYIRVETKAIHMYPQEAMKMLKDPKVLWSICPTAPKTFP